MSVVATLEQWGARRSYGRAAASRVNFTHERSVYPLHCPIGCLARQRGAPSQPSARAAHAGRPPREARAGGWAGIHVRRAAESCRRACGADALAGRAAGIAIWLLSVVEGWGPDDTWRLPTGEGRGANPPCAAVDSGAHAQYTSAWLRGADVGAAVPRSAAGPAPACGPTGQAALARGSSGTCGSIHRARRGTHPGAVHTDPHHLQSGQGAERATTAAKRAAPRWRRGARRARALGHAQGCRRA